MKTRSILTFLLMLFSVYAYADTYAISNILIDGLQNVKPKSVLSVVSLKKGEFYSADKAREDVRSIVGTGYFDNVEVCFDNLNGNLTFTVEEKPYIEHIIFKGNSEFSERKLKSESTLKEKDYYDSSKFKETKEKISVLYGEAGYVDCQIEIYPTVNADTNKMTMNFLITENNKITVEGVKIRGAVFFKEEEILKLMKINLKKVFKEDIYNVDLESIEKLYKNNGFMDYQFVSSTVEYNNARTEMFLTLDISEGNRYKIGSVTCNGNFAIDDKEIAKIIKFKKGQIFNQDKVDETVMSIYKSYLNKGYMKTKITPSFKKKDDSGFVHINLSIEENSVVRIGNIYIEGLVSVKDKIIRRELLIKPGEVFEPEKISKSREKIQSLGFINNIEFKMLNTGDPDIVDLAVSVVEGENGLLSLSAGYSVDGELTVSAQAQHLNIFGLGQRLGLFLDFSKRSQNYEISWTEPWVFDKNLSLSLDTFKICKGRDFKEIADAYNEKKTGFTAKVGHRINDYISLLVGYNYERIILDNINSSVRDNIERDSSKNKSSILAQFIYDSRDYVFDPSKGSRHFANVQLASSYLGGDIDFVKGSTRSTWFFNTFWKFVLCVNLQGGIIVPYGHCQTVPIYDGFYLGGSDTIRGYKYRTEIGPDMGGKIMGLMNFEYKFPIISFDEKTVVQGSIFFDIGGVWGDYKNVKLTSENGKNNLGSGIGFGIKLVNPFVPVRVDFGYGLNHNQRPGEKTYQIYFSVGESVF
ncbi:outer membrane protein assembly factor BamA [Candidatus Endomicrobiellum agilis]|uniref:outer membrane protein assembly factor BamA n=1 Tax=Candidatus Endomicrobiellum agilis TaxID=3238957 RepID=UPI0035765C4C|nr:outer membrane protein assembly factor BamA [Endomicrobium sp.]